MHCTPQHSVTQDSVYESPLPHTMPMFHHQHYTCILLCCSPFDSCWTHNTTQHTTTQQTIGDTLEKFATSVRDIADALPNQPPVKAITDNLTDKTKELGKESHKLNKAVVDLVNAPSKVVEAGLHDFNFKLKELLDGERRCLEEACAAAASRAVHGNDCAGQTLLPFICFTLILNGACLCCDLPLLLQTDLKGQQAHAADLGKALGKGPLADIAVGLNKTMAPLTKGFEVRVGI